MRLLGRRLPHPSAVILAYLLVLGVVALGGFLAAPLLAAQFRHLAELLPQTVSWVESNLGLVPNDLTASLAASVRVAGGLLARTAETVSELVLALVLAVMISLEPHLVQRAAPYLPGQGWDRSWRTPGAAWATGPGPSSSSPSPSPSSSGAGSSSWGCRAPWPWGS